MRNDNRKYVWVRRPQNPALYLNIILLKYLNKTTAIIIRCIFYPIFIDWEPTTWPANKCLQVMVCSCVIPSKSISVTNNILLIRNSNQVLVVVALVRRKPTDFCQQRAYGFHQKIKNQLGDQMIKQLLNSVITKYCDCQCLAYQARLSCQFNTFILIFCVEIPIVCLSVHFLVPHIHVVI